MRENQVGRQIHAVNLFRLVILPECRAKRFKAIHNMKGILNFIRVMLCKAGAETSVMILGWHLTEAVPSVSD